MMSTVSNWQEAKGCAERIFDFVRDYVETDGVRAPFGKWYIRYGLIRGTAGDLFEWCFQHGIEATPIWEAMRAIEDHREGVGASLEDVAKLIEPICMVIWKIAIQMRSESEGTDNGKQHDDADDSLTGIKLLDHSLSGPPTPLQSAIWEALDGRALKTDALASEVAGGDASRLYYTNRKSKTGGLKEMRDAGCVKNKPTVGHYRPDAPPPAKK